MKSLCRTLLAGLVAISAGSALAVTEDLVYCGQLEQVRGAERVVQVSSRIFHLRPAEAGAQQLMQLARLQGQRVCFPVITEGEVVHMDLQRLVLEADASR